jgi:hypothetical protein
MNCRQGNDMPFGMSLPGRQPGRVGVAAQETGIQISADQPIDQRRGIHRMHRHRHLGIDKVVIENFRNHLEQGRRHTADRKLSNFSRMRPGYPVPNIVERGYHLAGVFEQNLTLVGQPDGPGRPIDQRNTQFTRWIC